MQKPCLTKHYFGGVNASNSLYNSMEMYAYTESSPGNGRC